jgi:hypothetical protein
MGKHLSACLWGLLSTRIVTVHTAHSLHLCPFSHISYLQVHNRGSSDSLQVGLQTGLFPRISLCCRDKWAALSVCNRWPLLTSLCTTVRNTATFLTVLVIYQVKNTRNEYAAQFLGQRVHYYRTFLSSVNIWHNSKWTQHTSISNTVNPSQMICFKSMGSAKWTGQI